MVNKIKIALISLTAAAGSAVAQTTPVEDITAGVTTVSGIWDTVSALMIGVAIVTIGLRFLRKAR